MKKGFLASLGTLLAGAGISFGQAEPVRTFERLSSQDTPAVSPRIRLARPEPLTRTVEDDPSLPAVANSRIRLQKADSPRSFERIQFMETGPIVPGAVWGEPAACPPRFWVSGEYLAWWITKGPIGVPLVTTGDPASPTAGAIGDPSTQVLFGDSSVDYGTFYGGRISMGYWFGMDARVGIEASAFALRSRSSTFVAASDAAGNPLLALPFQLPNGTEARFLISTPALPQTGSVQIGTTSRLWGADLNGVWNVNRNACSSCELLAGFRYYDLQETLQIDVNSAATLQIPGGDGGLANFQLTLNSFDSFNTRNQFYGGQIGARGSYRHGRFSVDLLGLIALGVTHSTLNIDGGSTITVNGVVATPAGGIYTKPSNIGTFHSNRFSVIPQGQLKLGYNLTQHIRATVGYDAMFWTGVLRPGNQIDRVLGPQPGDRPAPLSNRSNLCAHGISVGLEFQW